MDGGIDGSIHVRMDGWWNACMYVCMMEWMVVCMYACTYMLYMLSGYTKGYKWFLTHSSHLVNSQSKGNIGCILKEKSIGLDECLDLGDKEIQGN